MSKQIRDLVVSAINGSEEAFSELVLQFQKPVFFTVLRVVRDRGVADDITQEIFVKVFQKIGALKNPDSFKSWLLRAALNRAIDCHRKMKREGEKVFLLDDFSVLGMASGGPGGSVSSEILEKESVSELEEAFQDAVDAMPENQRKVLWLSMNDGLSHGEIGKILSIPSGTVKSRLHHARKFLSVRLRRFLKGDVK